MVLQVYFGEKNAETILEYHKKGFSVSELASLLGTTEAVIVVILRRKLKENGKKQT